MDESSIERYLVAECKKRGVLCEKFTSPGRRAVPDRILMAPGGRIVFAECKAPGRRPRANQLRDHERRRRFGATVRILDSRESVRELLDELVC